MASPRNPAPVRPAGHALHIPSSVLALALRDIAWWQAAVVAAAAVAVASRVRPPRRTGAFLYAVALLTLVLVLFDRLDIVAAAWGVLAWGDGMATVVGRRAGGPTFPWNREKTLAASAAFVCFGGAAGALLAWWCRPQVVPPAYAWFSIAAPVVAAAAAAAAAAVETIPIRLPDNLSVPLTGPR